MQTAEIAQKFTSAGWNEKAAYEYASRRYLSYQPSQSPKNFWFNINSLKSLCRQNDGERA